MMRLCKEVLQTSMKEGVLITIERTLTEEMDSKKIDSMEVISEEIHFKVTLIEVIPMEEITIEEITIEPIMTLNERDTTHIEILITQVEKTTFLIRVLILVENNHRLPEEARHEPHHLILGLVVHMARDQI